MDWVDVTHERSDLAQEMKTRLGCHSPATRDAENNLSGTPRTTDETTMCQRCAALAAVG